MALKARVIRLLYAHGKYSMNQTVKEVQSELKSRRGEEMANTI